MKTKIPFLFLALLIAQPVLAQESAPTIMQKAEQQAATQNKDVFLLFHASWCGWCKRMDQKMTEASTESYFDDHFVITHVTVLERKNHKDLENPGGMNLLAKYKGTKAGLPFWVILGKNGNVLTNSLDDSGSNLGCPATTKEVAALIEKLKATTDITQAQQKAVASAFILKK